MLPPIDISLLIIQGVVFLFVLWFLNRFLFKPVLTIFHQREERTDGFLDTAEKIKIKAGEIHEQYEKNLLQAKKEVLNIRKSHALKGKEKKEEVVRKAREEAQLQIEEMRRTIKKEIEAKRDLLTQQAERLGREMAGKILGRSL